MTLVVKPSGRGNWTTYEISINRKPDLFTVHVGAILHMGAWKFRVIEVRP